MKLEPDDPTGWFENGRWIENTGLRFLAALRTAMADMRGALDTVSENYIEAVVDGSRWPGQFYKGAWLPARPLLSMIALAPVLAARTDDPRCEQALRETGIQFEIFAAAVAEASETCRKAMPL